MTTMEEKKESTWKCKLCSMDNSEYITYCEMCLVSRKIQKNESKMKQLQKQLNSIDNKFINAQKIRDIAKLLNKFETNVKRLKNCKKDANVIYDIQNEIQNFCNKMKLEFDENIVQDFITKYNICDEKHFSKQKAMNNDCSPICKCGTEMLVMKESKCYTLEKQYSCVICDICNEKIRSKQTVYHCPKQKLDKIHPDGFDICTKCRKKYVHRLRYFVALIICPNMTDGKIKLNDDEKLITMFKKLGFHKIICLKGDQVTKESVENAIKDVLPSEGKDNETNINQFTTICYSGHGATIDDEYYFALDVNDPKTWVSSDIFKNHCQATSYGSVKHGIKNTWNEMRNGKYYRHNTLLLLNSCRSGGADRAMNAQRIADYFGIGMAWTTGILSALGLSGALSADAIQAIGANCDPVTVSRLQYSMAGFFTGAGSAAPLIGPQAVSLPFVIGLAVVAGIGILSAIIIYLSVQKSMKCESMTLIASCDKIEASNACYPTSPFIQYVTNFFDTFLGDDTGAGRDIFNRLKINCDSPGMLFTYLQERYSEKVDNLGGATLNALNQRVQYNYRGFQQFAMCPIFNQ